MAKGKDIAKLGAMGSEIPGDDLTGDFDPLKHPSAYKDMSDLEAEIDGELDGRPADDSQPSDDGPRQEMLPDIMESPYADELQDDASEDDASEARQEAKTQDGDAPEEEDESESVEEPSEDDTEAKADDSEESESVEDRLARLERETQISKIEAEKQAALNERIKARADRIHGEYGSLVDQIKQGTQPNVPMARQDEPDYRDDYPQAATNVATPTQGPGQDVSAEITTMRQERTQQTIAAETSRFETEIAPFLQSLQNGDTGERDAFVKDMQNAVAAAAPEYQEELSGTNPKLAARIARSIYRTAYADARIALLNRQEEAARTMKAERREQLRGVKKAASQPRGGRSAKASPRARKSAMTMPLDELEKQVDSEYGVSRGAGPEII